MILFKNILFIHFTLILLLLNSSITYSQERVRERELCHEFDNRKNFNEERDQSFGLQGVHGTCSQFATSDLLREALLPFPQFFKLLKKDNISALSMYSSSQFNFGKGILKEGNSPFYIMKELEDDLLLETDSLYPKGSKTIQSIKEFFYYLSNQDLDLNQIKKGQRFKDKMSSLQRKLIKNLNTENPLRNYYTEETILKIYQESIDRKDDLSFKKFLRMLLIPLEYARDKRTLISLTSLNMNKPKASYVSFVGKDFAEKASALKNTIEQSKRSVILAFKLNHFLKFSKLGIFPHALILNAMKFNEETHQCEVHLRNSWGPQNRKNSGWYPLKKVLDSALEMDYITF